MSHKSAPPIGPANVFITSFITSHKYCHDLAMPIPQQAYEDLIAG